MNPQKINYFVAYEYPKNEKFYAEVKSVEVINLPGKSYYPKPFTNWKRGQTPLFFFELFF
jgi:hypothetical protein